MVPRPKTMVDGGWCHVHNGMSDGESVSADPNEAIELVEIVRDVKMHDGWPVVGYCPMAMQHSRVLEHGTVSCRARSFRQQHLGNGTPGPPMREGRHARNLPLGDHQQGVTQRRKGS